jgi:hypothetical protein
MTEADYFNALHDLLDNKLILAATLPGGHYSIAEPGQKPFTLIANQLSNHKMIAPEKLPTQWSCFRLPHAHAHKRCDRIVVSWDKATNAPQYLLLELKSHTPGTARKQLAASLAFCHFIHRMVCVNQNRWPGARFGAVTVMNLPAAMKLTSTPALPKWENPPIAPDCKHMRYPRSRALMPVGAISAQI